MSKQPPSPALATWIDLNAALMEGDLETAEKLLAEERKNKRRKQFMLRIHSRICKLRNEVERQQLIAEAA